MRRRGMTLIEVLVAIFVMGIGLIAILALFPIGVLRMAQAIQDSRIGNIARSADSLAAMKKIRDYNNIHPGLFPVNCFKSPGIAGLPDAADDQPSYPVYVDPSGWIAGSSQLGTWIPRRTVKFAKTLNTPGDSAVRWFSFLDDIYFEPDGTAPASPKIVEREFRYSWAYMLHRPRTSFDVVNMAVVVYKSRGIGAAPSEQADTATFYPSKSIITTAGTPPVRPGEWVLDATQGKKHAYFYRVVAVNDKDIEVQTPLRDFAEGEAGTVYFLEGVAEVFEKGSR